MTIALGFEPAPRREWPAWQVPPHARAAWVRLREALLQLADEPACADDPEQWSSTRPEEVEWAQSACAVCPVRQICLAYALEAREPVGVWGGLTATVRKRLGRAS